MLAFYSKILKRQWRLAAIRLFCVAVAIACAVTFSITLLGDRLEQLFNNQAKEVLAADLVLQSTTALTTNQQVIIADSSLRQAQTLTFQTMANANEAFLLSSVKAVSAGYPLRGQLQITNTLFGQANPTSNGPPQGEVWAEDRVLNELALEVGQSVNIGEGTFKITRVLVYEPDRGNSFYSFTPRIMMHWDDVAITEVVQPGSRVKYRYLFSGDSRELDHLQNSIKSTLQLNQEFVTVDAANQTLATTLKRAYRFLHITALIAVLLGAVGAALVSYQYASEMTYQYAVLRCLGLQGKRMVGVVLVPFIVFSLMAVAIGLVLGGVAHLLILQSLGELIPETLPLPSAKPFLLSSLTALIVVASFAWPFLQKLLHTTPKLLLNRVEMQQHPIIITAISMLIGLSILVFMGTQELLMSAYIIIILCVFIALAYLLTQLVINWVVRHSQSANVSTKLSARMINANRRIVSLQIIAIAVTFFSLALITTVRDDLLASWQSKVPENAPNIFVINLFESEKDDFLDELRKTDIPHSPLYPIVRGRLSTVNNQPIRVYASKESGRQDESLSRDLALSWNFELPKDNKIVEGSWHDVAQPQEINTVSVEQGLAENLEIELGDTLEFTIETQKVQAMVTSIRSVEWESFTPNFYMIFYPGSLEELPTTYLASLHLKKEQRSLLPELIKQFPSATFFDVEFLLNRIRGIAQRISYAVETILYFSLFASLVVFIAIEMILRHYRTYSTAIYKALGARVKLIQKIFRSQFIIIGLIAGMIAYALNVIIGFVLSIFLIEGDYILNYKTAILCLLIAPLLVLGAGYLSIQRTSQIPAKQLLSEN